MTNVPGNSGEFSHSLPSPALASLPPALAASAPSEERMMVFFEAGKCSLTQPVISTLKHWVHLWNTPSCRRRLNLGGADETSRTNRLRRLSALISVLEDLGVDRRRIQVDSEWLRPTRMGIIDDMPVDAIWLQFMR